MDKNGYIWIETIGQGVFECCLKTKEIIQYNTLIKKSVFNFCITDITGKQIQIFTANQPKSIGKYSLDWYWKNSGRMFSSGIYFLEFPAKTKR